MELIRLLDETASCLAGAIGGTPGNLYINRVERRADLRVLTDDGAILFRGQTNPTAKFSPS